MRALAIPFSISVSLPASTYRSHNAALRDSLRSTLALMNPRRITVKRGQFDIEIGMNSARSMDFMADIAKWQLDVEDIIADNGLDIETGEVES